MVSNLPPSDAEGLNREIILKIFSSIGRCRFLEEKHFDACTALSGSGPAFACIFLEAMADGGVMMGLPRAEALELAAQSTSAVVVTGCLTHLIAALPSTTRCCSHGLTGGCAPSSNQRFCHKRVKPIDSLDHIVLMHVPLAPGGCTIAGLLALEDGRVRSTIARAIQVATERASELGQPATK